MVEMVTYKHYNVGCQSFYLTWNNKLKMSIDFDNIFINKSTWENFNDEQMKAYVERVFQHYRQHGFPYYPDDKATRHSLFHDLKICCASKSVVDYKTRTVKQSMNGLALCWSYFPHAFTVRCNDMMSPMDAFNDDDTFRKVIEKRVKYGDNMSDNGIRKTIKIFTGVQSVSNFRPTAAASIYRMLATLVGKNSVKVYDPCCGYGGRLMGAICSGVVREYHGCDPCTLTYNGLTRICDDFYPLWKKNLYHIGCEDLYPGEDFDIVFTSPPYFDTEKYSEEPTQSYLKYPTPEEWMDGFLMTLVDNAYQCLRPGGVLCLNIADVSSYKTLVHDFLERVKKQSSRWNTYKSFRLSLSSLKTKNNKENTYKYEPIFIFVKK